MVSSTGTELDKAKRIYDFIKTWYQWDGKYSKYSEFGIKKAFDRKKGNVADINLSLLAALRYAGIEADPVILSTRDNGLPIELYPVLSDYNYVIASALIGGTRYLLDATDRFTPFGLLPLRCLNGKGRLFDNKESSFVDLVSNAREKVTIMANLELATEGSIRGKVDIIHASARAVRQRQKVAGFVTLNEYITALQNEFREVELNNHVIEKLSEIESSLRESFEVELAEKNDGDIKLLLFNPFFIDPWKKNPFKSKSRTYPVDFGYPIDETVIVKLKLPDNIVLDNVPAAIKLGMPDNGGRLLFETRYEKNEIIVTYNFTLTKNVYASEEYPYLRELFDRVVAMHSTDLVLTQRP